MTRAVQLVVVVHDAEDADEFFVFVVGFDFGHEVLVVVEVGVVLLEDELVEVIVLLGAGEVAFGGVAVYVVAAYASTLVVFFDIDAILFALIDGAYEERGVVAELIFGFDIALGVEVLSVDEEDLVLTDVVAGVDHLSFFIVVEGEAVGIECVGAAVPLLLDLLSSVVVGEDLLALHAAVVVVPGIGGELAVTFIFF